MPQPLTPLEIDCLTSFVENALHTQRVEVHRVMSLPALSNETRQALAAMRDNDETAMRAILSKLKA